MELKLSNRVNLPYLMKVSEDLFGVKPDKIFKFCSIFCHVSEMYADFLFLYLQIMDGPESIIRELC